MTTQTTTRAAEESQSDTSAADFPRLEGETDDSPRFMRAIAAAPG